MKFGILSSLNHPFLQIFLSCIPDYIRTNICVIIDSKPLNEKNLQIWSRRTSNNFSNIPSLYSSESPTPFYFVENHVSKTAIKLYRDLELIALFNCGTPRKISTEVIDSLPHGVINVHPGLLPFYRGCSCVEWAVINNDRVYLTAHYMTSEYDAGPIIATFPLLIESNFSYTDLRAAVYVQTAQAIFAVIDMIVTHGYKPDDAVIQNEKLSKYWDPMSEEIEQKVIEFVNSGHYQFSGDC